MPDELAPGNDAASEGILPVTLAAGRSGPPARAPVDAGNAGHVEEDDATRSQVERTRQAVALCGQAVIRAYEDDALYAEVCRLLVRTGGYRTAWIGVAELEPVKLIRPVAYAGAASGDWDSIQVSWANDARDRSPTGRAVREQRPRVARNILQDPRQARLRPDAEKAGYAATCALPLQYGPHGNAVLTVHAEEPDAFSTEEVSLLRELASDLSAGVTTLRDRSAREELEDELDAAEVRYRDIIERSPAGIFRVGPNGTLRFCNPALAHLLGYESAQEFIGKSPGTLVAHLKGGGSKDFLAALPGGKLPQPVRAQMLRKDGTLLWVAITMLTVRTRTGPAIEGFVLDLTASLREKEVSQRLLAVIESTAEAIFSKDLDGTVQSWNHGAEQIFGYSAQEAVGKTIVDLIVPQYKNAEEVECMAAIRAGRRVPHFETQRRCKDGRVIDVSVAMSPLHEGDKVVGASVTEHDITQSKLAEEARKAVEMQEVEVARLSAINKVRLDFISQASHELNTPLTPIRLELELLKARPGRDGEDLRGIEVIERNIMRMGKLVKDMLDSSRIESGNLQLDRHPQDLRVLLQQAFELFQPQADAAGIAFVLAPSIPCRANVDSGRITQVLFNILSNAIKFTSEGGRVEAGVECNQSEARIWVSDTGLGLTPDQIANLFAPFSRLHQDIQGAGKGTGLGLFISKGLIEQHGGRILVESPGPRLGSTWSLMLPLASADKDAPTSVTATPENPPDSLGKSRPVRIQGKRHGAPQHQPGQANEDLGRTPSGRTIGKK